MSRPHLMHITNLLKPVRAAALAALLCLAPGVARVSAATITWDAPQDIAAAGDVNTSGTLFGTWAPGNGNAQAYPVNGVVFEGYDTLGATSSGLSAPANFGTHTTADANYNALLRMGARGGTTARVTINGTGSKPLAVGHEYLVQLWVSDATTNGVGRTETVSGSSPVSYQTGSGMGQHVVGHFTADAVSQQLDLSAGVAVQFNLVQVRDLTAPDYYWNNGAGTGNWNTHDTNWTGLVWGNSPSNNAFFTTVAGNVNLSAISAGHVNFGNTSANIPSGTFSGGSLQANRLTVQGRADNGGSYGNNPTLTLNVPEITIAGDLAAGRANLAIAGGCVTASRITSSPASADWGRLVLSGGTLTVTNGIDGSLNGSVTFAMDLDGGTLATPFIKVSDRSYGAGNSSRLTFNGATIRPTASTNHFISLYGNSGVNAYVGGGGAIFDTDGHDIGIGVNLLGAGSGGLTKNGAGTLTLSGTNGYLGATIVNGGCLSIARPFLPSLAPVSIATNAVLDLNFIGQVPVGELRLDGVPQPQGLYGAGTHPGWFTGAGQLVVPPPFAFTNALAGAPNDGLANLRRMKYGLFVHYVWGGSAYTVTVNSDGSRPAGINDVADRFDAAGFANDLALMQVEYVIFTAWHANINLLGPSATMDQWIPGHTTQRDMLGDMINAVKAKGIRVLLYTHPRDGHDLSLADQVATGWGGPGSGANPDWNLFDRQKWNDFINDVYGELVDRYGSQIDGLYLDEGSAAGDSYRVVDYPRLRQTIKRHNPDLVMVQNWYGNLYSCDLGDKEYWHWGEFANTDGRVWPVWSIPVGTCFSTIWWAQTPVGANAVTFSASDMFRYTVLQAGGNTEGGGVQWAAGPYPGGGWETGVLPTLQQVGAYIQPIRRSICNTYPSASWVTPPGTTLNTLTSGFVATRSADDATEFIHVLTPPATNAITVMAPADGRGYASASLLTSGHPVTLTRNGDDSLTLTLQPGDAWDALDTVIALAPVTVTWTGADEAVGPGTGTWSDSVDHFTGGAPVATRFRSGDNVSFAGAGATNVYFWQNDWAVGDLSFAGRDYHVYPKGSPVMTLNTGRIDVTNGVTAAFHQNGSGGPLTLAGAAGLTKSGDGTLILDLPTSCTGSTVLNGGVLSFASGGLGVGGNVVFQGGTLAYRAGNADDISSRIRHSQSPVAIDTGGNDVVFATPLASDNTAGLIKLGAGTLSLGGGLHRYTGPTVVTAGTLRLDRGTAAIIALTNAGFEIPALAANGWSYNPTNTGWTFSASSGTARNGSPWVTNAPEGVQAAFIQNNGSMSCVINVTVPGSYVLAFEAANRPGYPPSGLTVTMDGRMLTSLSPGQIGRGGDFNAFQCAAIPLAAGAYTLSFQGVQNGSDSGTVIDAVALTGIAPGTLPATARLQLAGSGAVFDPGPGPLSLASLAGPADSQVVLSDTDLALDGNDPEATFAGAITGTGNVSVNGTLRLVGNAVLSFTGGFTNHGVLDLLTWNGTLPAGFVNHGIVLDRSDRVITSFAEVGGDVAVTITGYAGHNYQLQRSDTLPGDWQDVGAPQVGAGAPLQFTDAWVTGQTNRFYRIKVSP